MTRPNVKGLIIRPDKTVTEATFTGLEDFQAAVGGYIEAVGLRDGSTMYVDEEFLLKGYGPDDFNSIASDVAGLGGRLGLTLTGILGPVVIVGPVDDEGWDTDITPTARRWVERVAAEAGATWVSTRSVTFVETDGTTETREGGVMLVRCLECRRPTRRLDPSCPDALCKSCVAALAKEGGRA